MGLVEFYLFVGDLGGQTLSTAVAFGLLFGFVLGLVVNHLVGNNIPKDWNNSFKLNIR